MLLITFYSFILASLLPLVVFTNSVLLCHVNVLFSFLSCKRLLIQDSVPTLESSSVNHQFSLWDHKILFSQGYVGIFTYLL